MPEFQIEMIRECGVCKFIRPGLTDYCFNCGSPKSETDKLSFPNNISENDALHGEKYIRAVSGPDWNCKFCNKLQNNTGTFCEFCGSPKNKKQSRVDLNNQISDNNDISFSYVKKSNVKEKSIRTSSRLIPLNSSNLPIEPINCRSGSNKYKIFGVLITVLFLIAGSYFLFRTKIVNAHVSEVYWERNVTIERYQLWSHEGWDPDNNAVDIQFDRKKIHHYDHVKIGSHIEKGLSAPYDCHCKTKKGECHKTKITCTSNKNGSARCSGGDEVCDPDRRVCDTCRDPTKERVDDYRDDPVYKNWYTWKMWDWGFNRTIQKSGNDFEPYWPSEEDLKVHLQPGENERYRRETPVYKITFMENGSSNIHIFNPSSEEEYKKYPKGKICKLKVNFAVGMEILSCN